MSPKTDSYPWLLDQVSALIKMLLRPHPPLPGPRVPSCRGAPLPCFQAARPSPSLSEPQFSSCSYPSPDNPGQAQFAPRLTHNERTLVSRFRGRAICFLLKPQPRNCAARSLKAMASFRRTAQLPVTARRAGAVRAHSVAGRRCPPGMLGAESLSE